MELISIAQKGRPLTREEHEKAVGEGIPAPFMDGMAQITEELSEKPAAQKSSYKPQGPVLRFLISFEKNDSCVDSHDRKGMAKTTTATKTRQYFALYVCPRRSQSNLLRKSHRNSFESKKERSLDPSFGRDV